MAKVYYGMATYPAREKCLKEVVPCIMPQCTKLFVYLNQYSEVPKFLVHPRINVVLGEKEGNCGDIGKFHFVNSVEHYFLTVDDDLIYPPNYSEKMVRMIDDERQRSVIGVHGCVLNLRNMWNYYRSRNLTHYRHPLRQPRSVHVIGTGTAGFHVSTIKISKESFPKPNMADIWFALEGQKQKVPFKLIPRERQWLKDAPSAKGTGSIYSQSKNKSHGKYQTKVIQDYGNWQIYS